MEARTKKEYKDIIIDEISKEVQVLENDENEEISISYITMVKRWNRKYTLVDIFFAYNIVVEIIKQDMDLKHKSIEECRQRNDWPK